MAARAEAGGGIALSEPRAGDGGRSRAGSPVLEPRGGLAERIADAAQGRHPVTMFAAVVLAGFAVLAGLMIVLGLLLTDVLLPFHGIGHDDEHVNVVLAAHRSGFLTTASAVVSGMADVYAIPAIVTLTAVGAAVRRHWRIAAFAASAICLESATYRVTSWAIERHRPAVHRLDHLPVMASYPSGHVAASIAVYVGVAVLIASRWRSRAVRIPVWAAAVAIPLLVAASRMYRGMHHPTDTAAGMLLGTGALLVALLAARTAGAVAERRERAPI
jgi:membrane-associated phospholipid phosphatase